MCQLVDYVALSKCGRQLKCSRGAAEGSLQLCLLLKRKQLCSPAFPAAPSPPPCPQKHESLRARSARTSPQGPAAADDPMGGGGQDENAAQLLLAIGKQ